MDKEKRAFGTVDEYIAQFSPELQRILSEIRATIRAAAPQAEERISYNMPGYFLNVWLVWFAANRRFIGFYPVTAGMQAFADEWAAYRGTKSSLHFPLNQPMPYDLIRKIVRLRVEEALKKAA